MSRRQHPTSGSDWRAAVEENREALEAWAESDLPLADDVAELLNRADTATADAEPEAAAT